MGQILGEKVVAWWDDELSGRFKGDSAKLSNEVRCWRDKRPGGSGGTRPPPAATTADWFWLFSGMGALYCF